MPCRDSSKLRAFVFGVKRSVPRSRHRRHNYHHHSIIIIIIIIIASCPVCFVRAISRVVLRSDFSQFFRRVVVIALPRDWWRARPETSTTTTATTLTTRRADGWLPTASTTYTARVIVSIVVVVIITVFLLLLRFGASQIRYPFETAGRSFCIIVTTISNYFADCCCSSDRTTGKTKIPRLVVVCVSGARNSVCTKTVGRRDKSRPDSFLFFLFFPSPAPKTVGIGWKKKKKNSDRFRMKRNERVRRVDACYLVHEHKL